MSDSVIDFIMEKIFPVSVKFGEAYARGDMMALVDKVIRHEFDVVEMATDGWHKETTEAFLERIELELLANPDIAAWYKEWLDRQRETEGDDYGLDNPRDSYWTGTRTGSL